MPHAPRFHHLLHPSISSDLMPNILSLTHTLSLSITLSATSVSAEKKAQDNLSWQSLGKSRIRKPYLPLLPFLSSITKPSEPRTDTTNQNSDLAKVRPSLDLRQRTLIGFQTTHSIFKFSDTLEAMSRKSESDL